MYFQKMQFLGDFRPFLQRFLTYPMEWTLEAKLAGFSRSYLITFWSLTLQMYRHFNFVFVLIMKI